jgi:uncharacterized protein (DUF433 family)
VLYKGIERIHVLDRKDFSGNIIDNIENAAGKSVDQILNEHPRLTHEAIQASCAFAADTNSPRA